jgi:YVTN family beta-propeller protein
MYENSSLSFYDYKQMEVYNHIFLIANNIPLGDVAQSMTFFGEKGYIVVNNSAKIYCINPDDVTIAGKITGFESPRHILVLDSRKAYVSDMYARKIFIADPFEMVIKGSIDTDNRSGLFYQHSAEQMVRAGEKIFAACWSFDNTILVIDPHTDQVTDSVTVARQPNSMVIDRNDDLWVLSDGGFAGSSYGVDIPELVRINTLTLSIEKEYSFLSKDLSPDNLCINRDRDSLYFLNQGVYKMSIYAESLPVAPVIEEKGRQFYSLGIDPPTSDVYVADALDYQQEGVIYRYNSFPSLVDSFRVGIIPGDFYFTGD